MKNISYILLFIPLFLNAQDIGADRYLADPDSTYSGMGTPSDSNDGSYANPWATWAKVLESSQSGEKVCLRGGVYYPTWTDYNDATLENDSVKLFGYPGEQPIIDGDSLGDYIEPNASNDVYNFGLRMNTHAYDSIINIEFRNFNQYDQVDGEGDTINWLPVGGVIGAQNSVHMYYEDVQVHDCMIKAFVQYSGYWNDYDSTYAVDVYGATPENATPLFDSAFGDTTTWVDCDAYNLVDLWSYSEEEGNHHYEGGNHADGWKGVNYQNSQYTWTRCRAWNYTDDGIDFNLPGRKIFNNCFMSSNGFHDTLVQFEGNGFKVTSNSRNAYYFPQYLDDTILVRYNNCITFNCPFGYLNDFFIDVPEGEDKASCNAYFKNSIGYGNRRNLDTPVPQGDTILNITVKNSLFFGATGNNPCADPQDLNVLPSVNIGNAIGIGDYGNNIYYTGYASGGCGRWDYYTTDFTVSAADFTNGLDSATIVAEITAPRNEDNSYSVNPFTLEDDSDLTGSGVDVGMSEVPDAGIDWAFLGSSPSVPSTSITGTRFYLTPAGGYYKDKNGNPYLFD